MDDHPGFDIHRVDPFQKHWQLACFEFLRGHIRDGETVCFGKLGACCIALILENCSLEVLQAAEKNAASKRAARRLQAIRLLYCGYERAEVARIVDCDAKSLTTWINRFNDYGVDGLTHDQERPGRPTKIPPEKHEAFKELLRNPHQIGRDFWTARVLHGHLAKQWQIEMAYSTVCTSMHAANFDLKSARPLPGMRQDFNPIEQVWRVLKTWWFNNHHCNTHVSLAQRVDKALQSFFDSPEIIRSICG